MTLILALLTAQTAGATETSTITVGSTDYTLFTGFTATGGNGTNYAKLVDGNTSTDWSATKNYDDPNEPANDFAGGTDDPAFVEFHADEAFIPKGYVLTCDRENAGFWKPVEWALKAKLNEGDEWTTIQSSTTTLGQGKTFEIACDNDDNNEYQYFRFEVYEVGTTMTVDLDELQFYGLLPAYTHLTVKAATCMATGIKQDCYRRNSDGKYFTDNTGETEIPESDVIAPIIPHTGEHHEATDVNIEYWQCSMCGKYFSDEGYTTEITEEQTKIYRTITIDGSISSLVTSNTSQALAGTTMYLYVSDLIDASTLKVNDGAVELTAVTDIQYTFTMPAADVTVTAEVAQSNADGDILTGSIRHTVTIPDGASITLNNAAISGSIVCEGSATITLVGTNSVSGATFKAGIQIGGSGTTLTIKDNGSLTANGGSQSAGIGLSRIWNYDSNVTSGDIVIEGGTITATGGKWGAGIGTGVIKNTNNDNSTSVQFGNVTIKGGTVTATGGDSGDGIGKGYSYPGPAITFGTVTIYDGIDKVDASSIKDFGSVVYMHSETNVTASKTDYFAIGEDGNRRIIVQKPVIADIPDQTYTGSAITPEPLVIAGSLSLTKGTDYTYSYENNTNVGTATVRATFQGDYASLGYVEKTFTINPASVTLTANSDTKEYSGAEQTVTGFTSSVDGLTFTGVSASGSGTDTGTYDVTFTGVTLNTTKDDTGNYVVTGTTDGTLTITVKAVTNSNIVNTGSTPTIALTQDQNGTTATLDGASDGGFTITVDVEVNDVKLNRSFNNGKKTCICWPFAVDATKATELGTFYQFTGMTGEGKIEMTQVTGDLAANTPYIFDPKADISTAIDFGAKTLKAGGPASVGSGYTFKGIYERVKWTKDTTDPLHNDTYEAELGKAYGFALENLAGYSVGQFVKLGDGAHSRAFRAYLLYDGTWDGNQPSAGARSATRGTSLPDVLDIVWISGSSQTTGIDTMANSRETDEWHSLDGRKLSGKPATKGLYIHNGNKVVIK